MGYVETRTVFERVEQWGERKGKCVYCGKAMKNSITVGQTINPFRSDLKDEKGNLKSEYQLRSEIREQLKKEIEDWKKGEMIHDKCYKLRVEAGKIKSGRNKTLKSHLTFSTKRK